MKLIYYFYNDLFDYFCIKGIDGFLNEYVGKVFVDDMRYEAALLLFLVLIRPIKANLCVIFFITVSISIQKIVVSIKKV